jgi:hypothetical protein
MSSQPPFGNPDPRQPQNPFGDQPPQYQPMAGQPVNPYAPGVTPPPQGPRDQGLGLLAPINTSVWAIAAGYLGLLSLGFCCLGPFAVFCGIMGLYDISKRPGTRGHIRSVLGIVFGLLGSLGLAFILVALAADSVR